MIKNYDQSVEISYKTNWRDTCENPVKIPVRFLIIGASRSDKTNVLLNLRRSKQSDIEKIYLYVKVPVESKYQLLMNEIEKVRVKKPKSFC